MKNLFHFVLLILGFLILSGAWDSKAIATPIHEWPTFRNSTAKFFVVIWVSPQDLQGFRISSLFKRIERRFKNSGLEFSMAVTAEPGFELDESAANDYIDRINWKNTWRFDGGGIEAKSNHVQALPSVVVVGANFKAVTLASGRVALNDIERGLTKILKEQNSPAPLGKEIYSEGDFSGCFQGETNFVGEKRSRVLGDLKPQTDDHWIQKENYLRSEKNRKSRLSFDFSGTTLGLIAQSANTGIPTHVSATVDNLKPLLFNVSKLRVYELASKLTPGSHRLTLEVQNGSLDFFGLQSLNSCPD